MHPKSFLSNFWGALHSPASFYSFLICYSLIIDFIFLVLIISSLGLDLSKTKGFKHSMHLTFVFPISLFVFQIFQCPHKGQSQIKLDGYALFFPG